MAEKKARKVLLIGWDAADWKIMDPLLEKGLMPTLKKFLEEGVRGRIATLDPPLSPMLWTSIATGKRADKHGILGFVEPDPQSNTVRPVSSRSRKVHAIWNMLNLEGKKSNVVGWWPSNPADPIDGVMVSNFYQQERKGKTVIDPTDWAMPPGTVHPERLTEKLAELRVHPYEITGNLVMPFVPRAVELDQKEDHRLTVIPRFIAHMSSIHAATTELMVTEPWDFMAVYHDAIDHFSHAFMKFHPPKMDIVSDEEFDIFKDVVASAYRFHDMMLERTLELCDDDTTVIICSDHGFHSDHLRPTALPDIPAGPALEHSPYGMFAAKGPGIKKGETIYGASILDVTPTILSLYGLPIGEDMDGKPLVQIFEKAPTISQIPSWDALKGNDGRLPSDMQEDPLEAAEAMQQLVDLGYIDAPGEDEELYRQNVINESNLYLARTYTSSGRNALAVPILERLYNEGKGLNRYGMELLLAYQKTGQNEEGTKLVAMLRETGHVNGFYLDFHEGKLLLSANRPAEALQKFEHAKANLPESFDINMALAKLYNVMQRWDDANELFTRVISIDHESAYGHHGLGLSLLRLERYEEAVDSFLTAIDIIYYYPFAHHHLGEALALMGQPALAANAFEVAISMQPGLKKAYKWLLDLYDSELDNPEKKARYQKFVDEHMMGTITVVSGLPRSGTSMAMQMLQRGGLEIFTDGVREADMHNDNGYFEHSEVINLANNKSWLSGAKDKALKVKAGYLASLPGTFNYKVIFVERNFDEVLYSQQVASGKAGHARANAYPIQMAQVLKDQDKKVRGWIKRQPNLDVMYLDYNAALEQPLQVAQNINAFLGGTLKVDEMVNAVDPTMNHATPQGKRI
jgi:predicted AlkP superfamily phosphohydrolase/phosphomutase/tetratricopeptide (TPR) repeat protein